MARFRPLTLSALILGLVALAAFGVRQVIVGQEGVQPETDRQFAPPGEGQLGDGAETQRERIRQFIEEGGDVCSLVLGDGPHGTLYPDLPTLINDVQLIVTGEPVGRVVKEPVGLAGRVLTTIEIDAVLSGEAPGPTVTVESSERLMGAGPGRLGRLTASDFDGCASGRVLLFLNPTERPGEFVLGLQGWSRIEGGTVEVAPRNELLQDYAGAEELLAAVRQIAQEQLDLPKGLLRCQFKRTSPDFLDPLVCPGDSFNPYQAFRLSSATAARAGQVEIQPGAQLSALLETLDTEVQMEPIAAYFSDATTLRVSIQDSAGGHRSFFFSYVPSAGLVQIEQSGGQFAVPAEFQQAVEPFLTQP